jgi:hypothetical protein
MSEETEHYVPTMHLRWRWAVVGIRYDRVLEQLWQGDMGSQRWIMVPTGSDPPLRLEVPLPLQASPVEQ